jgi:hypothetical protein
MDNDLGILTKIEKLDFRNNFKLSIKTTNNLSFVLYNSYDFIIDTSCLYLGVFKNLNGLTINTLVNGKLHIYNLDNKEIEKQIELIINLYK